MPKTAAEGRTTRWKSGRRVKDQHNWHLGGTPRDGIHERLILAGHCDRRARHPLSRGNSARQVSDLAQSYRRGTRPIAITL
jgi:hypothetical protein